MAEVGDGWTMQPPHDAVIFDMDGVVTDTAALQAAAWKPVFDEVLADARAGAHGSARPFDPVGDYRRYVDGRTRVDGVVAFLGSRGIDVPMGAPGDPVASWTIHGLAARINDRFLELASAKGVRAFPGTVALVRRLRSGGTPLGLVTTSVNASALLGAAGLDGAFDVVVDGNVAARLGLAGKPDPAMFLDAAHRLGVAPSRAAVIEDSAAGVTAARRGGFALVVGIDRGHRRRDLERAGADFVVDDVAELDLGSSRSDPWLLVYEGFDPVHETHREALTTLGNGYMATRGALPEHVDDGVHYPGTYLAGVYNRLASTVDGQRRIDEELVNAPNWLPLDIAVGR